MWPHASEFTNAHWLILPPPPITVSQESRTKTHPCTRVHGAQLAEIIVLTYVLLGDGGWEISEGKRKGRYERKDGQQKAAGKYKPTVRAHARVCVWGRGVTYIRVRQYGEEKGDSCVCLAPRD